MRVGGRRGGEGGRVSHRSVCWTRFKDDLLKYGFPCTELVAYRLVGEVDKGSSFMPCRDLKYMVFSYCIFL